MESENEKLRGEKDRAREELEERVKEVERRDKEGEQLMKAMKEDERLRESVASEKKRLS